jgi:DegV family protein with EDD domain
MSVAVVTDSTACLPEDRIQRYAVTVVPLTVAIDGAEGREGPDVPPSQVAAALSGRRAQVSTSRPTPQRFVEAYRRLLDAGAGGVVSVHLSAKLSATWESAMLAADQAGPAVTVVDARSTGMGLGFPVLAAAEAAAAGKDLAGVRDAALAAVERTHTLFYVDSLEFLRRGGRVGAASALVGTALSVKPILHVVDGSIVLRDKVRTASRALARLVDVAVEAAGESDVDVAVHHVDAPDRAASLARSLADRLGDRLRDKYTTEIGAVVAAHAGPGMAGVVVHRRA